MHLCSCLGCPGIHARVSRRLFAVVTLSHCDSPLPSRPLAFRLLVSAFVPRSNSLGLVSFFPWPFASFFWHIGWRCSFSSPVRWVAMVTVLFFLGSCWLPSHLWVASFSPSCASSFRLRILFWFQVCAFCLPALLVFVASCCSSAGCGTSSSNLVGPSFIA